MEVLKVGTRRSVLARAQTALVIEHLKKIAGSDIQFEEVIVVTSGDQKQGTPEAACGDKRDWIDVFEDKLLVEEIDLAIHCGKDVPVDIAAGLEIVPILQRETAADLFIGKVDASGNRTRLVDLKPGSVVGTASKRRQAQLKKNYPHLIAKELRGNINTRLSVLDDAQSEFAGIMLAEAGIKRLGLNLSYEVLATNEFLPAVNQGVLTIQFKSNRQLVKNLTAKLADEKTRCCFEAERAVVDLLQADCKSAVGVYSEVLGSNIKLSVEVLSVTDAQVLYSEAIKPLSEYQDAAVIVAEDLIKRGAKKLLIAE